MIAIIHPRRCVLCQRFGRCPRVAASGIAREESDNSLRGKPATLAAALTRRMVGFYVRMHPPTRRSGRRRHRPNRCRPAVHPLQRRVRPMTRPISSQPSASPGTQLAWLALDSW